jgi:hypothetical protein
MIPYFFGEMSDRTCERDRIDDLKTGKASLFNDPVVEDFGFRSKAPLGFKGIT